MSVAVYPVDSHALYAPAEDRALGTTGRAIRDALSEAMAPGDDRGMEIYVRAERAVRRASDEDGTLVGSRAFGRALALMNALPPDIPLPEVVVESNGEIGLDWDEGTRRTLTLTVRDTPLVGFSALIGDEPMYGRVAFAGEIPEILRLLLTRLYPNRRARRAAYLVRRP